MVDPSSYSSSSPTQPLLLSNPYPSQIPSTSDQEEEKEPTQITYNYNTRPIKDLPFFILFSLFIFSTFAFGIFASIHHNPNSSHISSFSYDLNTSSCIKPTLITLLNNFAPTKSNPLEVLFWTLVITLVFSVPCAAFLLTLLKHYTKQIVYASLPFFVIVPISVNIFWVVAYTVTSSCTQSFPLVYRILVFLFVFLVIAVVVWIFVVNWHIIELTIIIIVVSANALSDNLGLFGVLPALTLGLFVYFVSIVVFLVFTRLNGKIVPREKDGEYYCAWKQDGWVSA